MNESPKSSTIQKSPTIKLKPTENMQSNEGTLVNPSVEKLSDHIKFKSRHGSEVKIEDSQEKTVNLEIKSPKAGRRKRA